MFQMAPGASLRCREFRWGDPSKKAIEETAAGRREGIRTQRLAMSGGKDGPLLALLCTQTRDLAGDHGVCRGDVVCFGAGSDEALSRPFTDADPTCGGPLGSFGRAAVPVGERRRYEQDDGGHDDQ